MKNQPSSCAVLAGTLGFSSLASAREWGGEREHDRGDRGHRAEQRQERQDRRFDRGDDAPSSRGTGRECSSRGYGYEQPRYAATGATTTLRSSRIMAATGQRFYRGGYLPHSTAATATT
jgi:hypothetical protein